MAWTLRHIPVLPVYGKGDYPIQLIYAEDVAAQAVEAGSHRENTIADAMGPETFSFEEQLRLLASAIGVHARLARMPSRMGLALTQLVGLLKGCLALTQDEVVGLMAGLLASEAAPVGTTRPSDWLAEDAEGLGRRYVSELLHNFRLRSQEHSGRKRESALKEGLHYVGARSN